MNRRIPLPAPAAKIYEAVAELEAAYPGRKFTPDGLPAARDPGHKACPSYHAAMSLLSDPSLPQAARIALIVLFVAMMGALGWAVFLLAAMTGHPMTILLCAGIHASFSPSGRVVWEKLRRLLD